MKALLTAVALSALVAATGSAKAAPPVIDMTVNDGTSVIDLTPLGGVGTTTSYTMDAAALALLNMMLQHDGSMYQFSAISGLSNFPGSSSPNVAYLSMAGEVCAGPVQPGAAACAGGGSSSILSGASAASGSSTVTLSETESGFTTPPPYYLLSSSTGVFINQSAGGGHTVTTTYNSGLPSSATLAPYSVVSTGLAANAQKAMAIPEDIADVIPFSITNSAVFNLTPGAGALTPLAIDDFTVTGAVVPEPPTWVMLVGGFGLMAFGAYAGRRRTPRYVD